MRRRLTIGAVAALSACTLLAGCGSSSSGGSSGGGGGGSNNSSAAPATEFADAFHALGSQQSLTTTLGLDTTSANLISITGENGGTPLTQSQADLITSAKFTVAIKAPSGKTVGSTSLAGPLAAGVSAQVTGTAGGKTYFTLTDINKNVYLQVDLQGIVDAAGKPDALSGITAETASLPSFVQDFLAGKAIEIPSTAISSLSSLLQGAASSQGSSAVPNPSQLQGAAGAIENAVLADLTVTRTSSGSTDELEASGNIRTIAGDVISALATALPAASGALSSSAADQVPDKTVKLSASVTGGSLSKLEFDFGQFSPGEKDTLPIAATFSASTPDITAPSGATQVTFQDLVSFFTAFSTISSGSSSASAGAGSSG